MLQPKQFLIEGIDRMGKSTLTAGILNAFGYRLVIHYDKPKKLLAYANESDPLKVYQMDLYSQMFRLIESGANIIFDRAHLGELVYAPLYRKYNTDYVLHLEKTSNTSSARLVLLITSDFGFIQDDGKSFDFNKKEEEQARFIKAFNESTIKDKVLVDVSNGNGSYKSPDQILAEVLRK